MVVQSMVSYMARMMPNCLVAYVMRYGIVCASLMLSLNRNVIHFPLSFSIAPREPGSGVKCVSGVFAATQAVALVSHCTFICCTGGSLATGQFSSPCLSTWKNAISWMDSDFNLLMAMMTSILTAITSRGQFIVEASFMKTLSLSQ